VQASSILTTSRVDSRSQSTKELLYQDFNVLSFDKEFKGGNLPSQVSTNDFGTWVNPNNILAFLFLIPFIL